MERSRRRRDDTEQQQQQSEIKSAGDERSETTARDDGSTEDDDEQAMGPAVTATDAEHTATGDEAAAPAAAAGGGGGTEAGADVSVLDGVECKFNVNSYRMVFVVNTESFLYRRHALATAHRVSATCTRPGLELHNRLTAVDPGLPG